MIIWKQTLGLKYLDLSGHTYSAEQNSVKAGLISVFVYSFGNENQ